MCEVAVQQENLSDAYSEGVSYNSLAVPSARGLPLETRQELYEIFKRNEADSIDHEMMERVFADFANAFILLEGLPPSISVFGSARSRPGTVDYQLAREVGFELGRQGFGVITGGGPGIMEAAVRGGKEAGASCVGLNIVLPHEQEPNQFLDVVANFEYFFARKVMFAKLSEGFIVMPGGFGTMDELFEILTLRQTAKMPDRPVVLVGHEYWDPLIDFLRHQMLQRGYISSNDLNSIVVTDSPQEAVRICRIAYQTEGGLPRAA